jgi:DNA-binding Lrp family transcriptional regulator
MLISCELGEETDTCSQLLKIPHVQSCLITYGNYDIVVEIETSTQDELNSIISSKIRRLDKIRSTITLRVTN